jgi:hypothetical protein
LIILIAIRVIKYAGLVRRAPIVLADLNIIVRQENIIPAAANPVPQLAQIVRSVTIAMAQRIIIIIPEAAVSETHILIIKIL